MHLNLSNLFILVCLINSLFNVMMRCACVWCGPFLGYIILSVEICPFQLRPLPLLASSVLMVSALFRLWERVHTKISRPWPKGRRTKTAVSNRNWKGKLKQRTISQSPARLRILSECYRHIWQPSRPGDHRRLATPPNTKRINRNRRRNPCWRCSNDR